MAITEARARKLANAIKHDLSSLDKNLKEFHALQAWLPLGYSSFLEFWDAQLGSVPISTGLRNWAIYALTEEQSVMNANRKPVLPRGAAVAIAEAVGVTSNKVSTVKHYQLKARGRTRKTGHDDDDQVVLATTAPYRWQRRLDEHAFAKNVNRSDLIRQYVAAGMRRAGLDI